MSQPLFSLFIFKRNSRAKNELGKSSSHWLSDSGPWGWGGLLGWDPVQNQGGTSLCNMLELAQGDRTSGPVSWNSGSTAPCSTCSQTRVPLQTNFGRAYLWSVHICGGSGDRDEATVRQAAHPEGPYLGLASLNCRASTWIPGS